MYQTAHSGTADVVPMSVVFLAQLPTLDILSMLISYLCQSSYLDGFHPGHVINADILLMSSVFYFDSFRPGHFINADVLLMSLVFSSSMACTLDILLMLMSCLCHSSSLHPWLAPWTFRQCFNMSTMLFERQQQQLSVLQKELAADHHI